MQVSAQKVTEVEANVKNGLGGEGTASLRAGRSAGEHLTFSVCPGGTLENSPRSQPWEARMKVVRVPKGRLKTPVFAARYAKIEMLPERGIYAASMHDLPDRR
jgi:hypothetical protein